MAAPMGRRRDLDELQKKILGAHLAAAREQAGFGKNQKHLAAKAIGVSASQLSQWEKGRVAIELPRLLDIAGVYGVPLDDLVSGLNARYNLVIDQRLPPDARRHLHARLIEMAHAAADVAEAAAPAEAAPPAPAPRRRDKSVVIRARRKRLPPKR